MHRLASSKSILTCRSSIAGPPGLLRPLKMPLKQPGSEQPNIVDAIYVDCINEDDGPALAALGTAALNLSSRLRDLIAATCHPTRVGILTQDENSRATK